MSNTKRRLEDLSVAFGYGGEITDDVFKLSYDLTDFLQANGITHISELPAAGDWQEVMDKVAEQFDEYGTMRGWSLAAWHPADCKPKLAVVLVFESGLVTVDLADRVVQSSSAIHTFQS